MTARLLRQHLIIIRCRKIPPINWRFSNPLKMNIVEIRQSDPLYPAGLKRCLGVQTADKIITLGNVDILKQKKLALFCSVKCPGNLILQTYDLAQKLRDNGITVISEFRSPIEKECLNILLRGPQPVIICPARSLQNMRIPAAHKKVLLEGPQTCLYTVLNTTFPTYVLTSNQFKNPKKLCKINLCREIKSRLG